MSEEPTLGWTESLGEEGSNPSEPRTSGETLFALGKEWRVSSFENRLKAQFEQWLRRRSKAAIMDAEVEDGPDEAAKMRSAYLADLGAGLYTWDGRHGRTARGDLPGLQYVLYLALRRCHPDVRVETVEAMFKENARNCGLALRWVLGNSEAPAEATKPGPTPAVTTEEMEALVTAFIEKTGRGRERAAPPTLDRP